MNPNRKIIPQYTGRIGQQVQRANPYFNRTVIPSKEIDPIIISKLLLNVSSNENNILDLKEFIMKNGITTNDMLNEDGQSILHIILQNENLSKRQKIEIIKFFRDNFTLLESFDKNGLTPLHIASKLQLTDIVKELLDAKHNVNVQDNTYKTPLHYAVIGNQIEIPDKIDKKLFPKKKFKVEKNDLNEMSKLLRKYINETEPIKQFIKNCYETLTDIKNLFSKDIQDLENKYTQKSIDISYENITEKQKKDKLFKLTNEKKVKTRELIQSKISSGKKQIQLEIRTEEGWSPDLNLNNAVLQYKNIKDIKKMLLFNEQLEKKSLTDNLDNINKKDNSFASNILNMTQNINMFDDIIRGLIFTYNFIDNINIINDITDNGDGTYTQNNKDEEKNKLNEYIQKVLDEIFIETNNKYYSSDIFRKIEYNITEENVDIDGNLIENIKTGNKNILLQGQIQKNIEKIFNDFNNETNQTADDDGNIINVEYKKKDNIDDIELLQYKTSYYKSFTMKYKVILGELNNILKTINSKFIELINLVDLKDVYKLINEIIVNILSIQNKLFDIEDINKIILIKLENSIRIMVQNSSDIIITLNSEEHDGYILHKILIESMIKLKNIYDVENVSNIQNLFDISIRYFDLLNKVIKYKNDSQINTFITKYFNEFNETEIYENDKEVDIDNIYYDTIQSVNSFKTYDEIKKTLKEDLSDDSKKKNKTTLVSKFLLQMSEINNNIYIKNTLIDEGIIGILYDLNNLDINKDDINLLSDKEINKSPIKYNIPTADKIGNMQNMEKKIKKSDKLIPLVNKEIGNIILIQKYLITRYIFEKILTLPDENSLKKKFNEMKKNIIDNNNLDESNIGFLLIIIGKLIDTIINVNLDYIVNQGVDGTSISDSSEFNLINITDYQKIKLAPLDMNNLEKLEKDVYRLFKENKKSNLFNYFEDILEKEMKKKNIYKIMSSNIGDKPLEIYLDYDPDLIDILINKGADVNVRDKDGNTPFNIALIQTNKNVIERLLKTNVSVSTKKSKNRLGFKPIDICKKIISTSIENFNDSLNNNMIKEFIKENNELIKKLTKINHDMRYNELIFSMMIYLLNHYFYSKLNSYFKQKNRDLHTKLFTSITTQINVLPLLDINENNSEFLSYYEPVYKLLQKKDKKEYIDKLEKYKNLTSQSILLNNEPGPSNEIRQLEIDNIKTDIEKEKIDIQTDISNNINYPSSRINLINFIKDEKKLDKIDKINVDKIEDKIEGKLNKSLNKVNDDFIILLLQNLQNSNIIDKDILKMYDKISEKIRDVPENSDDYRTYPLLWKYLIKKLSKNPNSDNTQIIDLMLNKIKNNIDDEDIIRLSSKTLKVLSFDLNNYFDLPNDSIIDNYVLDIILKMIVHIVKNIMMINLYHIILKLLRVELTNILNSEDEIEKQIENILNNKIKDKSLKEYLFNDSELPEYITKAVLNIKDDNEDELKDFDVLSRLKNIDKFIESNDILSNSQIIKLLREYVYPYFKDYFQTNIVNLKKVTDGYLSMLLDFSTKLEIYDRIIDKSKSE